MNLLVNPPLWEAQQAYPNRKHNTKWLEKRINFISSMQTTELYIWIVHIVLYLPMLYVSMFHIPRLSGILTSWNVFVVNLGIKFVPQVLIQFFISHSLTYLISWIFRWEREKIIFRELILNIFTLNMRQGIIYFIFRFVFDLQSFYYRVSWHCRMFHRWASIDILLYMLSYLHRVIKKYSNDKIFRITNGHHLISSV